MSLATGNGVHDTHGNQLMIYGYELPNYLPSVFANTIVGLYSLVGQTSFFDLTGLQINHEVVVAEWISTYNLLGGNGVFNMTMDWYRSSDDYHIFHCSTSISDPGSGKQYPPGCCWCSWIGYCTVASTYLHVDEIMQNGDYYVVFNMTGGYTTTEYAYLSVSGISTATTYLSNATPYGCRWSVYGLSAVWDDNNYIECCITTNPNHPASSGYDPWGILDTQYPPTNGSVFNTPSQDFYSGLSPNTPYTLYAYAKAANGLWYPAGAASITTSKDTLATPYLDYSDSTATGITISIAPVSHANRYFATCNGQQQYNSSGDFSWSNLVPNYAYQVTYYATDTSGAVELG